jgi:hypothetical protein
MSIIINGRIYDTIKPKKVIIDLTKPIIIYIPKR